MMVANINQENRGIFTAHQLTVMILSNFRPTIKIKIQKGKSNTKNVLCRLNINLFYFG
jgi:hypothetical protein